MIIRLTKREKEIANLIAYEHTTIQIADKLFISTDTVKTHKKNLFQKLCVKNMAGLVRICMQKKLLTLSA